MSPAATAAAAFGVGVGVAVVTTPTAIALARRIDFYDRPGGYHKHAAPTPLLGGAAVLVAFLVAAAVLGDLSGRLLVVVGLAVVMWAVGTLDDAVAVPPQWRVLVAAGAAVVLYAVGLGWNTAASGPIDLILTILWIVGLVNAFNLMDNLDGACGAVAAVSAGGIGVLAAVKGQPTVAAMALGLSGGCAGFLRWNLTRPARIFLGDGGSMPLGFLIAALAMAVARNSPTGRAGILLGALCVGIPMLDVTLVSLSRTLRGVSLMTGGRDHLTHRILLVARSPRIVALVLGAAQLTLCGLALTGYELGTLGLASLSLAAFLTGVCVVLVLDTARWRPAGIATADDVDAEPALVPIVAETAE